MSLSRDDQVRIRQYLLGQLTDAQQEEIELRFLIGDELFENLLAAEDELIDEYLQGTLTNEENEMFEKHFIISDERQQKLRFARSFRKYVATHPAEKSFTEKVSSSFWKQLFSSSRFRTAVFAILVLGIAIVVWRLVSNKSDVDRGLEALNSAYHQQRPIEARISGFQYAPFSITRSGAPNQFDEVLRRRAERLLLDAVSERPNAASQHALGLLYLTNKEFAKAITQFNQALKIDPNNAQIHADVGAAWFEKGKVDWVATNGGKGLEELGRSLEELNRALELDNSLLPALFNRALCREFQTLPTEAEKDWRLYLEKDSTSQWAQEATRHLKSLEDSKVGPKVQNTSLDSFLNSYRAADGDAVWIIYTSNHRASGNLLTAALIDHTLSDSDANVHLDALVYLGRLEQSRTNDLYTSDLARFYSLPHNRALLSEARALVRRGYELFGQSQITEAMESFAQASKRFARMGDTCERLSADFALAHAAAVQPDIHKGRQIFTQLVPECEERSYKWLLAQCFGEMAHLELNLNEYSKAMEQGNRALRLLEEVEDQEGVLSELVQLASIRRFLNDSERSLDLLQRGSQLSLNQGKRELAWGAYITTAFNFNALGLNLAALDYEREALQIAIESRIPLVMSRSYEYLGLTCGNLRRYDEAISNIQRAYEEGKRLQNERNGQNMMANASLKLGDLYRISGDQLRALAAYEESLRLYDRLGFPHYSYAAHKGKFLSYLSENNDDLALQELPVVLELFEEHRGKILSERQRNLFFDNEQDVYDLAIEFTLSKANDARRAFQYSESSRARSLLDLVRSGAEVLEDRTGSELRVANVEKPLSSLDLQAKMPEETQILQYAVLNSKLLIWFVTKSEFSVKTVDIDASTLTESVVRCLEGIHRDDEPTTRSDLKLLSDVLIKPVEELLDHKKILCIVPDKALNYVPFSALISTISGRYLVEEYKITISPSSTIFVECTEGARAIEQAKEEKLFAVGNPSFDVTAYPQLPTLRAAEHEAEAVASWYRLPLVLLKERATLTRVRAELPRADVVHLAAHYIIDSKSNLASKLLLAPSSNAQLGDERSDDGLESREVYQMKLPRTRLVVLSACQTGIEHQYRGEGPIGFARPFIAAGIPVIVASLWPVDSEATAELMIAFHRRRKTEGVPTVQALNEAQRDLIASDESRYHRPYYWASFVTIGGYSKY